MNSTPRPIITIIRLGFSTLCTGLLLGSAFAPPIPLVGRHATASPGAAGDKPLWKAKGTPTGEVHGGTQGTPFKDKARGRLVQVAVRGGQWIDSIRCTWEDEGELEKGDNHGGDGGDEVVIKLEPGEALIGISGVLLKQDDATVVGSLTFKTTKRTTSPVGRVLDGPKFTVAAPTGQEICGFQGNQGDYLNAIGMVCRPKP